MQNFPATTLTIPILSIEELEMQIKDDKDDPTKVEQLCNALVQCHNYKRAGKYYPLQDEPELNQIRELLTHLPEDAAPYARAYLTYREAKGDTEVRNETVRRWLRIWANSLKEAGQSAPTCDQLVYWFIRPFRNLYSYTPNICGYLAEQFRKQWGKCAAVSTLEGLETKLHSKDDIDVVDIDQVYNQAIEKLSSAANQESYWYAAYECADLYHYPEESRSEQQPEYVQAHKFYLMALEGNSKTRSHEDVASICDALVVCCESMMDFAGVEKYCRLRLEHVSDDLASCDARYRLTGALEKQGKGVEARAEFERLLNTGGAISGLAGEWPFLGVELERSLAEELEKAIQRQEDVFGRKLKFEGKTWREATIGSGAGRIDLSAVDVGNGEHIIIELKRDVIYGAALDQIVRYIEWEKSAKPQTRIIGILCGYGILPEVTKALEDGHGHEIEVWIYRYVGKRLFLIKK